MKNLKILALVSFLLAHLSSFGQAFLKGTITNRFGPLKSVTVDIENTSFGTFTDKDGRYAFELDTGYYSIKVQAPGYETFQKTVYLNFLTELTEDIELNEALLNADVSIGSKSGNSKTQIDSPVPIDVVLASDLANTGQTELGQALHILLPNFFSVRQDSPEGTNFVDAISLRGLSPDQVLVLVNGKRRHKSAYLNINDTFGRGSAGTDINAIPINAIEKIEILRDGASSQYGSDALAGVINIILKKETAEAKVILHGGTSIKGDGTQQMIGAGYGLPIGQKSFLNISTNYLYREAVNRTGNYNGLIYGDSLENNPSAIDNFFNTIEFEERKVTQTGSPELTNASIFYNAHFHLADNFGLYSFGSFSYKNTISKAEYRLPYQKAFNRTERDILGYLPELQTFNIDQSIVLGLNGDLNDWTLDFAFNYGDNLVDIAVFESSNASLGFLSPTSANTGAYRIDQSIMSFDANRSLLTNLGILQVSFGSEFRIERYEIEEGELESYIDGGDTTSTGLPKAVGFQGYSGIRPEDALSESRFNTANYLELSLDTRQKLLLEAAARYEDYSDFGDNFSYKVAGRLKPFDFLTLRSSFSTGFKAPSLQQLFYTRSSTEVVDGELVNVSNVNSESTVQGFFGVSLIQPEISTSLSAGMAIQPTKNLSLFIDFYQIEIDDRIALSGSIDESINANLTNFLSSLELDQVQIFTNSINTTTEGFDAGLAYNLNLDIGVAKFSSAYSVTSTTITDVVFETPEELLSFISDSSGTIRDVNEIEILDRTDRARFYSYIPAQQIRNSLELNLRKMSLYLAHNAFGQVEYLHPEDGQAENWVFDESDGTIASRDQVFSWKDTFDASITFRPAAKFNWTLGANNLFNTLPDRIEHSASQNNGVDQYATHVRQFDLTGAYFYSQLRLTF